MSETRRYERIDIELPCRIFIPGSGGLKFEAFATSRNLGLGGLFVATSFLLREGIEIYVELALPDGPLPIRSRVAHAVGQDDPDLLTGMGIEFLDVDAHGRETLLRYFTPLRYQAFYGNFIDEFPHLKKTVPLRDVSLVLNLWEEWKIKNEGGPASTASGAPPAPARPRRTPPPPAPRRPPAPPQRGARARPPPSPPAAPGPAASAERGPAVRRCGTSGSRCSGTCTSLPTGRRRRASTSCPGCASTRRAPTRTWRGSWSAIRACAARSTSRRSCSSSSRTTSRGARTTASSSSAPVR